MGLLVTFFAASIFFSFLCSILEAVLLSITPAYVAAQDRDGTAISKKLSRFKEDIDRPLAAILTLNTIAHTAGAIGVGAQAAVIFGATKIEILRFNNYQLGGVYRRSDDSGNFDILRSNSEDPGREQLAGLNPSVRQAYKFTYASSCPNDLAEPAHYKESKERQR